jgi:two-component system, NtrC family, response regulator
MTSDGQRPVLLIVEDDPGLLGQLRWCFYDFEVVTATSRDEAIAQLRRVEPSVVTLDLGLPPDPGGATEGLAALEQILSLAPRTKVIVVTGNNDRENAVRAVGLGAYDFYQKPVDADLLNLIVKRAHRLYQLEQENRRLQQGQGASPLPGLIAASPEMLKVCRMVEKVAPADVTTMLLGESGTGKEVVARAIHNLSNRRDYRFVAINCAAIPENLLESELFGYEKGAFTGAAKQTRGKIEYADGGTLFLDEVGDLPMALQAKLLRFLQERVIERVGGREEIPVDVRVVCATHQDLQALIAEERLPRGSLLPHQRDHHHHPAASRAQRRRASARPRLPGALCPGAGPPREGIHPRGAQRHRGPPVARQRARAGEPCQTGGDHGRGRAGQWRGHGTLLRGL